VEQLLYCIGNIVIMCLMVVLIGLQFDIIKLGDAGETFRKISDKRIFLPVSIFVIVINIMEILEELGLM